MDHERSNSIKSEEHVEEIQQHVEKNVEKIQIRVDPIENKGKSNENNVQAPEKKLTLFALRLAVLEKMATGLGTLGFIWATVVLLGGFAVTLDKIDFWFITIILVIEGTRIFSRSHELEWQHQATWSLRDAGISSFRDLKSSSHHLIDSITGKFKPISATRPESKHDRVIKKSTLGAKLSQNYKRKPTRARVTSDVPMLPYAKWVFLSKNTSKFLYWLQLLSASACVVLSLMRLIKQQFGEGIKEERAKRNLIAALNIFYSLALAEALFFLMEKVYWEWTVMYHKLLEEVHKECQFGPPGMISINRFFYDAYSRCVNGSIFDSLKMDLVSFAMELLNSDSDDEQLIGARILRKFATTKKFSSDTLQKIEISLCVMERLVDMLSWKDPQEREIRHAAAEILSILAGKGHNSLRVAAIPGAMESISSLLSTDKSSTDAAANGMCQGNINHDQEHYEYSAFNNLGLLILMELAKDHDNCGKIGNTRALLPNLIDFMKTGEEFLTDDHVQQSHILTVELSLQVVKMLANTKGNMGKILRQEITEVVYTISNIRDILRHGENYPSMQKLGIEILTSLAMEDDATERIGSTGGIIKYLFDIFFEPRTENSVRAAAGEALAMLAYESESNCHRILKLEVMDKLISALMDRPSEYTTRIIRNLYAYGSSDFLIRLNEVTVAAAPIVVRAIMSESSQLQEVMLGLAAQMFRFMSSTDTGIICEDIGTTEVKLVAKLVQILQEFKYPTIEVPRIRRFTIELAIWMMRYKRANIEIFKSAGMKEQLESVAETTSDIESFNVFTGTIGLSRHSKAMNTLVATALDLLAND